ncbi:ABC transporter permease [Breznakia pachnodae]|uniref:Fluoroquinolone transport system permease protein n=1 Tax=Breznakia pachnodae TaxID=265178 RepID=A0ABU0DZL1_9FIRM|nr:ABC transporter permease [Breznakia pachnodae]MDQ0360078.1 fluoroquinolone transport system permease protein [Breznakia pachnodae]
MNVVMKSFLHMLKLMRKDLIIIVIALIPFVMGVLFYYGIPFVDELLASQFGHKILQPYYELFDTFLIMFTPSMFCFVSALFVLEERDDNLSIYLSVTPLKRQGYYFSRIGMIALISIPISILLVTLFHLSVNNHLLWCALSLASGLQGLFISIFIIAFSSNKVEGMAIGKITSLFTIGAVIPYFINDNIQYLFSFLPSFWMSKVLVEHQLLFILVAIVLLGIWIMLVQVKYQKRMK